MGEKETFLKAARGYGHNGSYELDKMERMIEKALNGDLLECEFEAVRSMEMLEYYQKDLFCAMVGWSIPTREWIRSMELLVRELTGKERPRVWKLAAGRGHLQAVFAARGISWVSTDNASWEIGKGSGLKMDALTALAEVEHDLVFWSWWPYKNAGDQRILDHLMADHVPAIFVGEGWDGWTGTSAVYERAEDAEVLKAANDWAFFTDLPSWSGVNDYTQVIKPR